MAAIPPWLQQPADPASHMAAGMRIGVQIGAQQAEERYKQQALAARAAQEQQAQAQADALLRFKEVQAAKTEQQTARDQALAEQKFSLAASVAAQKHEAMQQYQAAIAGGMDPNDAILKFGPAMSANTGAAAALRARAQEQKQPKTWSQITMPGGIETLQSSTGDLRFPPRPAAAPREPALPKVPAGAKFIPKTDDAPAHIELPPRDSTMTENQKMIRLSQINKGLQELQEKATFDISPESVADPKWSKMTLSKWKIAKKLAADLDKEKQDMEASILGTGKASKTGKGGRVRVKSPDGKVGSIPADQLDDALAHGYTQV